MSKQNKDRIDSFDSALHQGYEVVKSVKENGDAIKDAVGKTGAPQSAKNVINSAVDAIKGLGRKGKRQPTQRNMMVSKLMREEGLSLGEASKRVTAMLKHGGAL
jgi:hypothetical protein